MSFCLRSSPWFLAFAIVLAAGTIRPGNAFAQPAAAVDEELKEIEDALANQPVDATQPASADADGEPAKQAGPDFAELNLLKLLLAGGWPMIPIAFMLVLVITFTIERILGLRRDKVMPGGLTNELGQLATTSSGFDPRVVYRICQQYPSAASNVIRSMLLKIGRPHSEVEHAVLEANERESSRLYANVRWLNLAAAVTPLMGLFGTVWGMINAFYATANLPDGASKAQVLADGIVIALVTTLGGLFVAIPAAIAAHFFEGRIQSLFHEIDELLTSLLPQIERFEGKLRVSQDHLSGDADGRPAAPAELTKEPPTAPPAGRTKKADPTPPPARQPTEA
ncbi:MAG: MotA/TolQ/ExbB proton channel family protein [Pirellulales bacterium]